MDERMFSDTVIRVVQWKPNVFLACDIRYLNGTCVYEKLSYTGRRALLESLLDAFHHTELTALLTYDEVPEDSLLHGWEYYDDQPGTLGVFLPVKE
jgi:ATP-dependent DNA ligase